MIYTIAALESRFEIPLFARLDVEQVWTTSVRQKRSS